MNKKLCFWPFILCIFSFVIIFSFLLPACDDNKDKDCIDVSIGVWQWERTFSEEHTTDQASSSQSGCTVSFTDTSGDTMTGELVDNNWNGLLETETMTVSVSGVFNGDPATTFSGTFTLTSNGDSYSGTVSAFLIQ